jgi:hypothetical protein
MVRITRQEKLLSDIPIQVSAVSEANSSSAENPAIYLICLSLKCYDISGGGIGYSEIKEEVDKFLIPVAEQINLESHNMYAIQLVISTKYSNEVRRQFSDHQNWVLDSG